MNTQLTKSARNRANTFIARCHWEYNRVTVTTQLVKTTIIPAIWIPFNAQERNPAFSFTVEWLVGGGGGFVVITNVIVIEFS